MLKVNDSIGHLQKQQLLYWDHVCTHHWRMITTKQPLFSNKLDFEPDKGKGWQETDPVGWDIYHANILPPDKAQVQDSFSHALGVGRGERGRGLVLVHSHIGLKAYSSLLIRHYMRNSSHVLEEVINHQGPLKCPQTNFWYLPPEDCTWSTVLQV